MTYKWLNVEKSRYYIITVNKEESNKIVLNYNWGGCNTNRGGKKNISVHSEQQVSECIDKMMKRRKTRGYTLISP